MTISIILALVIAVDSLVIAWLWLRCYSWKRLADDALREHRNSLDHWQQSVLLNRSLHEDNRRLLEMLNGKQQTPSADWWEGRRN